MILKTYLVRRNELARSIHQSQSSCIVARYSGAVSEDQQPPDRHRDGTETATGQPD